MNNIVKICSVFLFSTLYNEAYCFNTLQDLETAFRILERRGEELNLEPEESQNFPECSCNRRKTTELDMKTVARVKRDTGNCPCGNNIITNKRSKKNSSESLSRLFKKYLASV